MNHKKIDDHTPRSEKLAKGFAKKDHFGHSQALLSISSVNHVHLFCGDQLIVYALL